MTVKSSANSVILIVFAFSEIFLQKIHNCLRILESTESIFGMYDVSLEEEEEGVRLGVRMIIPRMCYLLL